MRSYGAIPVKTDGGRGTYFVYVSDEDQRSLERETYTAKVKAGLQKNGFTEVLPSAADFAVFYSYSIKTTGQEATYTAPMSVAGTSAFAKGFNAGAAAGGGRVSSSDVCTRFFLLRVFHAATISPEARPLYERQVRSTGSSCDIGAVLPAIIDAAFENFPGEPGKTYTVDQPVR